MKGNYYFLIIILILMAAVVGRGLTFPHWESKFLPILLGSIGFFLAGIQLWRELVLKGTLKTDYDHEAIGGRIATRRFALVFSWIIGFSIGIYLLGFLIAIPVFVVSYLKWRRRSWFIGIGLAGFLTVLIYMIFELTLQIELYRGLVYYTFIH